MRVRKQDQNGDYVFGNGQGDFFRDSPEAVGQVCMTRLQLWRGEWFLDVEEGTPYLQGVIGKHKQQTAENVFRARILGTEGVRSIASLESNNDPEMRKLSVVASVDTIYGETQIEVGI